jgi:ABC-type Na+ efflux pump permease subunit
MKILGRIILALIPISWVAYYALIFIDNYGPSGKRGNYLIPEIGYSFIILLPLTVVFALLGSILIGAANRSNKNNKDA